MPPTKKVKFTSGDEVELLTAGEAKWFSDIQAAYDKQLRLTEIVDQQDLDRIMLLELMIHRWRNWLLSGLDYDGDMIDEERLRRNVKEFSDQLNKVKESMGLNKKARDSAASEGNFSAWLSDLKQRAKIFGVHREHQLTAALTLMNDLSAIVGAYDRSDEEERRKLGFESPEQILEYIRTVTLPEFKAIDTHFQQNAQQYWIRDQ